MSSKKSASTRNKTMKHNNHPDYGYCNATFHGIQAWYKSLFEELGWMILAKEHGMVDKTGVYKQSLNRLKETIERKMKHTKGFDKKSDLKIMYDNTMILCNHAEKDL